MTDAHTISTPKLEALADASSLVYVKTKRKVVWRNPEDSLYYVLERNDSQTKDWVVLSKGYRHSTSCYANLGRIISKETTKVLDR